MIRIQRLRNSFLDNLRKSFYGKLATTTAQSSQGKVNSGENSDSRGGYLHQVTCQSITLEKACAWAKRLTLWGQYQGLYSPGSSCPSFCKGTFSSGVMFRFGQVLERWSLILSARGRVICTIALQCLHLKLVESGTFAKWSQAGSEFLPLSGLEPPGPSEDIVPVN